MYVYQWVCEIGSLYGGQSFFTFSEIVEIGSWGIFSLILVTPRTDADYYIVALYKWWLNGTV